MKKVAVFGNTGGGKSTLAVELAEITGLPLVSLDKIQYLPGGKPVPHDDYLNIHSKKIQEDSWIIDGYGCYTSVWERFDAADTLIYVDLPLPIHFLWVTKRFIKGLWINPVGWPKRSPMLKSTLRSYQVLWLCHKKLTPRYRKFVAESAESKRVIHLKSPKAIKQFIRQQRES